MTTPLEIEVFLTDPPVYEHSLKFALSIAPSWNSLYVSRHQRGWVFVGGGDVSYALDNSYETKWMPLDDRARLEMYDRLGPRISRVYVER